MDYYERAGLHAVPRQARLQPGRLRLHDLHRQLRPAAARGQPRPSTTTTWPWSSVLSGNRNFEGRINPDVKMNYLASPPLVVAYALAGTWTSTCTSEPLGTGRRRQAGLPARHLAVAGTRSQRGRSRTRSRAEMFTQRLRRRVRRRRAVAARCDVPTGDTFEWDDDVDLRPQAAVLRRHAAPSRSRSTDIEGARVLAKLGDSVTTDHISPAGAIKTDTPGRDVPDRARRRARATSTPTARAAATTR